MTDHDQRQAVLDDMSARDLMRQLSEQATVLVRQEVELAKAELTEKGKRAGVGAGMFGAAGGVALYALGALTAAIVLLLSRAMTAWLAALIVAVAYGAAAGVLALTGRANLRKGVPPIPEQTAETVREDIDMARERAREGRR